MGLDMYLTKRTYVKNWDYMKAEERHTISISGPEADKINVSNIREIIEDAGYWRKANHIHKWFVENVQGGKDDCGDYYVTEENLKALLELTNQVLADHSKAAELLPTQAGFFFGGTEYDDYYFDDLEETKKILEQAVKVGGEYYYHSSW